MDTRTRIIATLGPATDREGVLSQLIDEGVDVFRLNFSHGSYDEHARRIAEVKRARDRAGANCAILLDTKGPEIRTGRLSHGDPLDLHSGDVLVLVPDEAGSPYVAGDWRSLPEYQSSRVFAVSQTYPNLGSFVEAKMHILLSDGQIELAVEEVRGGNIVCRVENNAVLGERKSLNIPGVSIPLPTLSDKDRADLLFGIEHDIDFVAASFVKSGDAVREIRAFLHESSPYHIGIIAKIENKQAVEDIDDIIKASDGVMVARGDLGVEMPPCEVPHLQKEIIRKCNRAHRPVITATQMLESMTTHPRPTRAEAADVANAIYDGADCVMLSGETAVGEYPVETVKTMASIIDSTERHIFESGGWRSSEDPVQMKSISHAVGAAAVATAEGIRAQCLICPTMTGRTARLMSSLKPPMPIYAVGPHARAIRQMQILWGVVSFEGDIQGAMRTVIENAQAAVCGKGFLKSGDIAVLTCGDRFTSPITRKPSGEMERFAPANVMYVIQIRDEAEAGALASSGDDALMTSHFFGMY